MKILYAIIALCLLIGLTGCAEVEMAMRIDGNATIPTARIAVSVNEFSVFTQLKKAAVDEYHKLSDQEKQYVQIQTREDNAPYIVAWVWNFPDQEKAQDFTRQFLGSTAQLTREQDLVILQATLKGSEMGIALNRMGADKVRPFLGNIGLSVKAYMPGEILSFVDGSIDQSLWYLDLNLGQVYQQKPTYEVEVISRTQ